MSATVKTLTTAEYAKRSGLSVSTVTKMLREGTLRGEKRSGKWVIFETDAATPVTAAPATASAPAKAPAAAPAKPATGEKYTLETFAQKTYLTETGVRQYLKAGRLTGGVDETGRQMVDAANLTRSDFKHLVRP